MRNELHNNVVGNARRYCEQSITLVALAVLSVNTLADKATTHPIQRLEVFTSSERPIVEFDAGGAGSNLMQFDVRFYQIDGIHSFEDKLSLDLPDDPKLSMPVALQRLQSMNAEARSTLELAAMGLTKAMHYGIDRTPAVVIDRAAVVYGVTDLKVALDHHHAWQSGRRP